MNVICVILVFLVSTHASVDFATPLVTYDDEMGYITMTRTSDIVQQVQTCATIDTTSCSNVQVTSKSLDPFCVYTLPKPQTTGQPSTDTTCTIKDYQITVTTAGPYKGFIPTIKSDKFFSDTDSYNSYQESIPCIERNGVKYVNRSEIPAFGTVISDSGLVSVAYTAHNVTVYFHGKKSTDQLKVQPVSYADLFPSIMGGGGYHITDVAISDEFLAVNYAHRYASQLLALVRVFQIDLSAQTIKPMTLSGATSPDTINVSLSSDLSFENKYKIKSCTNGKLILDPYAVGKVLRIVLTCPNTTYTKPLSLKPLTIGSALVFELQTKGWVGQGPVVALLPEVTTGLGATDENEFYFKTGAMRNGNLILGGESKRLYFISISSDMFPTGIFHRSYFLLMHEVFQNDTSDARASQGQIPGNSLSTVGPAIAFTYNATLLVGVQTALSSAIMVEYLIGQMEFKLIGTISGLVTPSRISPIGAGLNVFSFIDNQNPFTVHFATLPSSLYDPKGSPFVQVKEDLTRSFKLPQLIEGSELSSEIDPESRTSVTALSFANGRITLFTPLAVENKVIATGKLIPYQVGDITKTLKVKIDGTEQVTVTCNTEMTLELTAASLTDDICTGLTVTFGVSNEAYQPDFTLSGTTCTGSLKAINISGNYHVVVSSAGVILGETPLTIEPQEMAQLGHVLVNPRLLTKKTRFTISVTLADEYGNLLTFPMGAKEDPCGRVRILLYDARDVPDGTKYDGIIKRLSGRNIVGNYSLTQTEATFCSVENLLIRGPGQYVFGFQMMDRANTGSFKNMSIPSEIQDSCILWLNSSLRPTYNAGEWILLVIGILVSAFFVIVLPYLFYVLFNRPVKGEFQVKREEEPIEDHQLTMIRPPLPGTPLVELIAQGLPFSNNERGPLINITTISAETTREVLETMRSLRAGITQVTKTASTGTARLAGDGEETVLTYSFAAVCLGERVTVFVKEFSNDTAAENYYMQAFIWYNLPENRLAPPLQAAEIYHPLLNIGVEEYTLGAILRDLSTSPSHTFVILITEELALYPQIDEGCVSQVLNGLRHAAFNSIPPRAFGDLTPASILKDTNGHIKLEPPMHLGTEYLKLGVDDAKAFDRELQTAIAALAALALGDPDSYSRILTGQGGSMGIPVANLHRLCMDITTASWANLDTRVTGS
ncbi:hypothetical protein GMRT_14366 [Giardia muris]|uniref:Uncharacterized protein n=1 Tax=Giardia muris TaxID=5742 RepID=A0A4Z1SQS0_GIAMU|nr:hypothetical protein GMRT_14366 [Giardia muris]|eukprot:TNJ28214.1 hypothetical protein GMRT_14366 [Giardia muris]